MKLQNIIYPASNNYQEAKMYFRGKNDVSYDLNARHIIMQKDEEVVFNTYFNSFSANKWFKYTLIDNVYLKIKVNGRFLIKLIFVKRVANVGKTIVLCETSIDTKGKEQEIKLPFDTENQNGMFAFTITSLDDHGKFHEGGYYTDLGAIKAQAVKIAIVICTFKREKFVYRNMELLNNAFFKGCDTEIKDKILVYISDNGKSLDIDKIKSEHIKVMPNKNAGGAGGFTRGLMECIKNQKKDNITHALLMDDDIVIQPESIYRTYTLLSLIKPEYKNSFIGGAMLRLDEPWRQTESGARWNAGELIGHKAGLDLRKVEPCLYNEIEEECDYNAWWYCTIPMRVVKEDNLPMPIFIRGDDVEYGLRNMEHLILMNGICVWHEPFEAKYSSSMYYYIFRNRLIDNAIHNIDYPKEKFLKDIQPWFTQELFTYRYKNAQLLLNSAYDFLKGIEFLKNSDGESLNAKVMQSGYKLQDVDDLDMPFDMQEYEKTRSQFEGRIHRLIRKALLNGMFIGTKGDAVVPIQNAHILYFYRKDKVLNYDYESEKGFVTQRDGKEFIRLVKEYIKFRKYCLKTYDATVMQYRQNKDELTNVSFWKKYLAL